MFLFLKKTWKIGLSILFGVAVLLFWGSVYPAHISYQEQFQLFLFDADYWWERIVVPGGLADYIAEYLTQFYYHGGGLGACSSLAFCTCCCNGWFGNWRRSRVRLMCIIR